MNQKNDQKGTKGTIGTPPFFPHTCAHYNADSVDGVNLDKAGEMEICENTALQWLKRGMKKGLFVKIERGVYKFVHDAL